MIFTVCTVTSSIVCKIGERRQRIGELEFINRRYKVIIRLSEYELLGFGTVYENTVDTRRTKVAGSIIFSTQTRGEYCIHKHV